MTLDEYFGDWMKVIDRTELNNVMFKVGQEYKRKPLCPAQSDVFRAFEICPLKNLSALTVEMNRKGKRDLWCTYKMVRRVLILNKKKWKKFI